MSSLHSRQLTYSSRHRATRLVVPALIVLALSACSATRLLYENLDWLVFEALDDRFDVRSDQSAWIEERLAELHDWHRATQLPAYRETLQGASARLADGLQRADLLWLEARIEQHRRALFERALPDLARFLADLDAAQIARYAEFSQEAIEEAEEPLRWEERRREAHRLETFVERIEPWTGELGPGQQEALERDLVSLPDLRAAWLVQRHQRRAAFLELLSARPGAQALEAVLGAWWRDPAAGYSPEYAAQRRAFQDRLFELLVRLDARLSPEQRSRVADRLDGYVSTIDTVVAAR